MAARAVADTSRAALGDIEASLGARQQRVLALVSYYPDATARELTEQLGRIYYAGSGVDPNMVKPRLTELERAGYVRKSGARKCRVTGRTAHTWRVRETREQMELF